MKTVLGLCNKFIGRIYRSWISKASDMGTFWWFRGAYYQHQRPNKIITVPVAFREFKVDPFIHVPFIHSECGRLQAITHIAHEEEYEFMNLLRNSLALPKLY